MPPELSDSLAAFCFPHGVRPELLERTPSMSGAWLAGWLAALRGWVGVWLVGVGWLAWMMSQVGVRLLGCEVGKWLACFDGS